MEAPADKMVPLALGRSDDVRVGQQTLAIGNPFGLDHTLSTGVISGLEREIKSRSGHPIFGVIQTDAAINPGNSGGPLLDSRGRVIAINTAIYSPSGASAGIGFAVPIGTIERIVPQLIQHGRVVRPGLGITFDPALQARTGVKGILVLGIQPGSAADLAGIQPTTRDPDSGALVLGDILIAIDDKPIKDQNDLFKHLDDKQVGDAIKAKIRRGETEITLDMKLTPLPD
jgi:S1-C subfamily serine protease